LRELDTCLDALLDFTEFRKLAVPLSDIPLYFL